MDANDWPSCFVRATEFYERGENVTVFNDHGTVYMTGGERSQEYLYMENMPAGMENHC